MKVNFNLSDSTGERHECKSRRVGDWVIYECPHHECDYERRFNFRTGEMKFNGISTNVLHRGEFAPVGIDPSTISLN